MSNENEQNNLQKRKYKWILNLWKDILFTPNERWTLTLCQETESHHGIGKNNAAVTRCFGGEFVISYIANSNINWLNLYGE